jgi:hypothetical protein
MKKFGNRETLIPRYASAPLAPAVLQPASAQAGHCHRRQEIERPESGAVDDHVRLAGDAVGVDYAA